MLRRRMGVGGETVVEEERERERRRSRREAILAERRVDGIGRKSDESARSELGEGGRKMKKGGIRCEVIISLHSLSRCRAEVGLRPRSRG